MDEPESRVGEVLDERSSVGDRHHLHAAADAQQRHVSLPGRPAQQQLAGVALDARRIHGGVRLCPVVRRSHVRTPDEDESVQAIEHVGIGGVRREQDGPAAGFAHRVDVPLVEQGRRDLPRAPPGGLDVGRQADDGTCHAHSLPVTSLGGAL